MGKLVILSFGDGNFQTGWKKIKLEIKEDNQCLITSTIGSLPAAEDIPSLYLNWQAKYRQLGSITRIKRPKAQVTNFSAQEITYCGDILQHSLNQWLKSAEFLPIRDALFSELEKNQTIRVLIETEDWYLRLLPWHLWEFFNQYIQAEVALSLPECRLLSNITIPRKQARILAIIGDSTGINLEADRQFWQNLPNAEKPTFLMQPTRQQVYDALWDAQGWDILFFAGHSISETESAEGRIFINKQEYLEISFLKNTLRKAISRGLKLAIFNSCDGLGIANRLASLHIPQVIVMREPVPDMVAQEFLKYFLQEFSQGESLYLSVREAREKLESVEHQFPCANWLPVLCQNAAEEPVTWNNLCNKTTDKPVINQPKTNKPPRTEAPKRRNNSQTPIIYFPTLVEISETIFYSKKISCPHCFYENENSLFESVIICQACGNEIKKR
jgi:hypothetical protein